MSDTRRIEMALPGRCLYFISSNFVKTYQQYVHDIKVTGTLQFQQPKEGEDPEILKQNALVICEERLAGFKEIAEIFVRSWTRVLLGETEKKMNSVNRRMERALMIVLPPDVEVSGISGLLRVHYLAQELVDRDLWDPDPAYLDAFDKLSNLIQSSDGILDRMEGIEKAAKKAAPKTLGKLQMQGYYTRAAVAA